LSSFYLSILEDTVTGAISLSKQEGPGLKPELIWNGLPRAKARCYSDKMRALADRII
jgi:hypothetical protein